MQYQTKNLVFLVVSFLLLFTTVFAGEVYHMVFISNPTPAILSYMAEMGMPLDDARFIKGEGISLPLEQWEVELLQKRGIQYEITIHNLESHYAEICRNNMMNIPEPTDDDPVHMKYGSMGGFYTFQEIVSDLDSMRLLYPNLCSEKTVLGYGWDENPIYMVKISDNPDVNEDEPEVLIDALHHAREPGSYTAILYSMWYLLENYGSDEETTYLVDNREMYFVPVVNPDGLIYNQLNNPGGGGMWRKNRRNNGGSFGVDLNRNYSYQWGYNSQGSSGNPSSSTYRGPSPASEPETQAMMNFINAHNITTAMTIHTYGNHYLSAYGYDDVYPEHYDVHMDYMSYGAQNNGYSYGPCFAIMYYSNGRTQDWQLHEHDIINVEPEIGNSFWPSISYIIPNAAENLPIILNQFWCAGGQVFFSSAEVEDGFLNPGETENLIATVFNRGWGTSEPVNFEIETSDPYITLTTNNASTDSIGRRETADNSATPFVLEVSPDCPIGHFVEFDITIDQNGFLRYQQFTLMVGEPDVLFSDDAEAGIGNWNTSGGWNTTNLSSYSGEYSFSESPYGNYGNNLTAYMTLSNPINLTNVNTVWLEFWAKWDIESNYDFGQVEVSVDGINWTAVGGEYTVPGSGIGVQPAGQPGYEGGQPTYVLEHIDLNQYIGQPNFRFRFEFRSDGGVVGDGWNIDDIKLMAFTGPVTPLDITITLEPVNPPIIIPASGGQFEYEVTVTNNEPTTETFDAWIDAILPDSSVYGPVIFRPGLTFGTGSSVIRTMLQIIPAAAPPGEYQFRAHTGIYPTVTYDEDSFNFIKEE